MQFDTKETILDRYYTLLHCQLAAQLPRPGGIHKYSKGNLYNGFTTSIKSINGTRAYQITISKGISYGAYAMGFKDDGTRRIARGPLERINFKTIDSATLGIAKIISIPTGGKVVIK